MIVIMQPTATTRDISAVIAVIEDNGYRAHLSEGEERTIVGIIGAGRPIDRDPLQRLPGVEQVLRVTKPYKLASREFHPLPTQFPIGPYTVGDGSVLIMAGPCAVESRSQIIETAHAAKEAGAHILRGGAFKPRTSPYSFQGLGVEGLEYLAEAGAATGMPVVTEVMAPDQVPLVAEYADILQIGARSMQNYALLHAVGRAQHPALLKRGMSSTIDEWLMAAEYILSHGNTRVMLCERGIRTHETATRNTFDVNAIPVIKHLSHLPIIADPSHGTGRWEYVGPVARAAVAAGADGLIVEIHPTPETALSDGLQSLKPDRFGRLVTQIQAVAEALGRTVPAPTAATQVAVV